MRPQQSRIRTLWSSFTLLVAATLVATTEAHATIVVYDSFGPGLTITPMGDTGGYTIGPPGTTMYMGAPFSPSSTVDITSLTGSWEAGLNAAFPLTITSPITVSLWSGSTSEPVTQLESWNLTVDEMATNYTLTSTTHPLLVPGITYWVVEDYTNGVAANNFLGWGLNTAAKTLGLGESETSATTLFLSTDENPALEVVGTAVPESGTLLLIGSGIFMVVFRKRLKSLRRRSA
jgi:hypothetical protein